MSAREGVLEHLHRVPRKREAPEAIDALLLVPGRGLPGDHHDQPGVARPVTLIDAALVDEVARGLGLVIAPGASRRNLTVRGLELESLAPGTMFTVGEARLEVLGVCSPCRRMETALGPGALSLLRGRGGLYARVVIGGLIQRGDRVILPGAARRRRLPALSTVVARARGVLSRPT